MHGSLISFIAVCSRIKSKNATAIPSTYYFTNSYCFVFFLANSKVISFSCFRSPYACILTRAVLSPCIVQAKHGPQLPMVFDSIVCMGIVLHGICDSKPEFNVFFQIPGMRGYEIQGFVYLIAGYCCYLSGLDLAPYKAFYAMAAIGGVSFLFRVIERRNRRSGEVYYSSRKHSHRH
ncbi:hypothetical protein L1987_04775 [Smallanthus sonchifolius]|uniref:Uncharacterized protein n=1 Tax=Smallanthus sonchifolius TaxID=185202 RepID=A0ACB9JTP5_9ASTR|nr:hypothetical protein L1987_04775 [Smallanthus sonchifolius]